MNGKMRHTVYLFLGKELAEIAPKMKQYTLMYGEGDAPGYLQVFSCTEGALPGSLSFRSSIHDRPEVEKVFTSGLENRFRLGVAYQEEVQSDAELQQYFVQLFNRSVTIDDPGSDGSLNLCLFLPLYDNKLWLAAQRILSTIADIKKQIRVDVVGMPAEMSLLIAPESEKKEIAGKMKSYKDIAKKTGAEIIAHDQIHRLVLFEDTNSAGLALNLDKDRLIRVLGEFALLYVEHYHVIFPSSQMGKKIDVTAFGLSLLAFDKIYFVHYLLRKAYLYILHREKVAEEEKINVNHAADIAQKMLEKHVNLYKHFKSEKVEPVIATNRSQELNLSETQKLEKQLNDEISDSVDDLQRFIMDPSLSLPEKQAIMAQLLGEDDPLVEGVQYYREQLILDDCDEETLNYLIEEDNKCIVVKENEEGEREVERGVLQGPIMEDSDRVYLPLKDIKVLRAKIRQRTTYIRKKSEELNSIDVQVQEGQDIQKRLSEEGFKFGEEVFKLLPDRIETRLFKETYSPVPNNEQSVDLRGSFTPVKTQGTLGACSAFALVSIFEYILKKSDPSNPDLSERFAYYNALLKSNKGKINDEGSSLYSIVETMSAEGVATEELCPYAESLEKPSDEAYADGLKRLVKIAKNVSIKHKAITSALAEGYPVAISLKVFDSFVADKNGFIYRPKEDEIALGNCGNHAMVICGYSELDKIYIVRNSWGTSFGDRGYCYIPFSYIDDPAMTNQACIITDIAVEQDVRVAGRDKKTISFNMTDDNIRSAILRILIDEENIALKRDTKEYANLRYEYEKLLQVLANPTRRDEIYDNAVKRLQSEIEGKESEYRVFVKETRPERLNTFEHETTVMKFYAAGVVAVNLLTVFICFKCEWTDGIFWSSIVLAVVVLFAILYFWYRTYKMSMLRKELDGQAANINSKISQLKQDLTEKHLHMHLAGNVVSTLTDMKLRLVDKYHGIVSYNHALKDWEREERQKLEEMILPNKTPSISLLDNSMLDEYFEARKDAITDGICLYEQIGQKSMDDETILAFKFKLRDQLIAKLEKEFESFNMMDYLTNKSDFPFLRKGSKYLAEVLPKMDTKSTIFLNIVHNGVAYENSLEKHLFLHAMKSTERNSWRDMYSMEFTQQPSDNDLDSRYKLIELQVQNLSKDQVMMLN